MPNHVSHLLTVRGPKAELKRMMDYVASNSSAFSFRRIIPMPEALENTVAGFFSGESEEQKAARKQENARLCAAYGYSNWYDWACARWGTKWDAYGGPQYELSAAKRQELKSVKSLEELDRTLEPSAPEDYEKRDWWEWKGDEEIVGAFDTAWSPATPVYAVLADRFPKLTFTYAYADEGGGFVEKQIYSKGVLSGRYAYSWTAPEGIAIREAVGLWSPEDQDEGEDADEGSVAEKADPFANLVTGFPADNPRGVEDFVSQILAPNSARAPENEDEAAAIAEIEAEEAAEELRRELENDEIAEIEAEELYREHADEAKDDYYSSGFGADDDEAEDDYYSSGFGAYDDE